ncbi:MULTISPECIES: DMT family transporter [Cohaesibacter]|uniref:DMT family transporter n=1 Tax=Cohaesibacter TaxID=655352 RepID=UPI000DEA1751|nr:MULTISPECIES: DMT family transporter [Cohaesibacter]TLP45013.1 DMT family transporter [Cohaesibacter sp. CAU 1516]
MRNNSLLAYGLLAIATLSWSGNIVIGRAVRSDLPPLGMTFWRWSLCCLILLFFTAPRLKASLPILKREWKLLLVMAATGIGTFNPLQYVSLHTTSAINVTLILATCPAFMALLSVLFLKDRLGLAQIAGIAISFIGVAIVITDGDLQTLREVQFAIGDIFMLCAAIIWAFYSIAVKKRPADLDPLVMLTVITGAGSMLLLGPYLWETFTYKAMPVSTTAFLTVGYITLIASLLAYVCYNKAVSLIGPSKAGPAIHLMPGWVAILAFVFLGERLESYHLLGIACIAAGIFLNSRKARIKA